MRLVRSNLPPAIFEHRRTYQQCLFILTQFIEEVKEGWKDLPSLKSYALSLSPKKGIVNGIKVVGKIELPEDNRKQF